MDPMAEADTLYELDRDRRRDEGRPRRSDSCSPCDGWGTERDEDGERTCRSCDGDGLTDEARRRRRRQDFRMDHPVIDRLLVRLGVWS